jgi:hypothetical protein
VLVSLLLALRDLYSKHLQYWHHEPWELAHVLFSRGYVENLADETEIAATVEAVRTDWPRRGRPAA